MEIPTDWMLRMSDLIAEYMVERFTQCVRSPTGISSALPSLFIPTPAVCDADRIVNMLVRAYKNPGE